MIRHSSYQAAAGIEYLHHPDLNKGTAFTEAERDALGLRGLLPPHVATIEEQTQRVMENLGRKPDDLEKYIFLVSLQERNRTLFFHVLLENLEELMPIVYTPTVGKACQLYGHIWRQAQGLYICKYDAGHMQDVINNWPEDNVSVIVVTDGERILGLGDLGANGMGIPVGKLSLYSTCAGIDPRLCLPITIDVGTNNDALRQDPLYIGVRETRTRGQAYDDLIEEFMQAVRKRYPQALVQFEDFGNQNAFRLLKHYREKLLCFNDDIQGTAAVTLAGLYSALRITRKPLSDQKILFLGAGEAGIGIGELVLSAMIEEGLDADEARKRLWFVDSKGLVVNSRRQQLANHKLGFAHDADFAPDLLSAVHMLKPTAIIGVSGQPSTFKQAVVEAMTADNERPVIFALSNPTAKSECTAEEAYQWSNGRAIFASGSPFDPVKYGGTRFVPGQANNAYVFPGLGLGVVLSRSQRVSDEMFMAAAKTLAKLVDEDDLHQGRIFPPLTKIRDISAHIAAAVAATAFRQGYTKKQFPTDAVAYVKSKMYEPVYPEFA